MVKSKAAIGVEGSRSSHGGGHVVPGPLHRRKEGETFRDARGHRGRKAAAGAATTQLLTRSDKQSLFPVSRAQKIGHFL